MGDGHTGFCPRCLQPLGPGDECGQCGLTFVRRGGVLDVLGEEQREQRASEVESFYTRNPFPGYAPGDDGPTLLDRSRSSPFLAALDQAIPPSATVLDCGCGTAQLATFLALAAPRRRLIAIDGCRESLACADEFHTRARVDNLQLVRADLFDLPVSEGRFEVVISRGVVHHTPDPDGAIERVARCVAPGGVLLLGFYETMGRFAHGLRRSLGKLTGRPIAWMDPVLRRRDLDDDKKRIWIADQYEHPLEHILPLPKVLAGLRERGFRWVRSVPPASAANMFDATPEPTPGQLTRMRLGWALGGWNDPDAGLVFLVVRRAS